MIKQIKPCREHYWGHFKNSNPCKDCGTKGVNTGGEIQLIPGTYESESYPIVFKIVKLVLIIVLLPILLPVLLFVLLFGHTDYVSMADSFRSILKDLW